MMYRSNIYAGIYIESKYIWYIYIIYIYISNPNIFGTAHYKWIWTGSEIKVLGGWWRFAVKSPITVEHGNERSHFVSWTTSIDWTYRRSILSHMPCALLHIISIHNLRCATPWSTVMSGWHATWYTRTVTSGAEGSMNMYHVLII